MSDFTVFTVFGRGLSATHQDGEQLDAVIESLAADGITTRGVYDVSGLKAEADIMVWLHGTDPAALQAAVRRIRRTVELDGTEVVWSAMGVHRDAEFNKRHVPGFARGERPRNWLTVYPFNRSFDWYILPDEDRSRMLADHGRRGSKFEGVVANTVAAFALGDYEWLLPMEADELTDLVDMMRDLRATEARMHVREEIPFFTGRRIPVAEIAEVLR